LAAHIHKGRKGKAGAVVVPLGGKYNAKGCQKASKQTIEAIESRPNDYYANIHNARYPNGALRGQLVVGMTG
jgi:CHRD domain